LDKSGATRNYNSAKAEYDQLQQNWEALAEEIMELEG
jgi:ATP-binding cassette subfamily F protein 3